MMTSLNSLTNVSSLSSFDGMSRLLFLSVMVLRQKACCGIFSDMHEASPYSCYVCRTAILGFCTDMHEASPNSYNKTVWRSCIPLLCRGGSTELRMKGECAERI